MADQLKEELVKGIFDQIEAKIEAQPEVEMTEPKELVGREVCQQPSGFLSTWLQCSMNFDKLYPRLKKSF